jgi:hypothetical protein
LKWWISCDESGMHAGRFYGFGGSWMGYQRRGDFSALVEGIRAKHDYEDEFKWTNIGPGSLPAYLDLVDAFFRAEWLAFHCVVFPKSIVRRDLHKSKEEMYQKHFTMFLTDKIRRCFRAHRGREQTFRVWVDPLPTRYAKAHEAIQNIANNVLKPAFGKVRGVDRVNIKDSKQAPSIQLADLLLGAVLSEWEGKVVAPDKLAVRDAIANNLGWSDLRADTDQAERKFNIWMFHDDERGSRTASRRDVVLRHPLPTRTK